MSLQSERTLRQDLTYDRFLGIHHCFKSHHCQVYLWPLRGGPAGERAPSFAKDVIVLMIKKMDDIPNTTPIGQDRKTLTFKALLQDSNEYVFQRSPFSA